MTYDSQLAALVAAPAETIPDVIARMEAIDALLDGSVDGLKWFNGLYLEVTKAVAAQVKSATDFIAVLDVQFANLYFEALSGHLSGGECPSAWRGLFERRAEEGLARVQFAVAGINAHIDRDLPFAIVATCKLQRIDPVTATEQYAQYTALNATLDSLIDTAKRQLMVDFPGDRTLVVHDLEWAVAVWSVATARKAAWWNSELLWGLQKTPWMARGFGIALDQNTQTVSDILLTRVDRQ